jgi:hypothetical protein
MVRLRHLRAEVNLLRVEVDMQRKATLSLLIPGETLTRILRLHGYPKPLNVLHPYMILPDARQIDGSE